MTASARSHGIGTRAIQLAALLLAFGVLFAATRLASQASSGVAAIAAVGILLLGGTLLSELLEPFGLPHLTGYLAAGVLAGPHVFHLLDHRTVETLSPVNTLALALIALAGGAELRMDMLRGALRSLVAATVTQSTLVLLGASATFVAAAAMIPFARDLPMTALLGVSALWGVLAISRSPSATLAILSQTRAKGPVTTFTLAFVMSSDVVVILLLALAMMVARPLITPGAELSLSDFSALGHEIVGSVALGTTAGLLLAAYLRLVGRQLQVVLLALGFGLTEALRYVHVDPLLAFLSAGFVVQNFSKQGDKLLHAVEQMSGAVFVVFFATAGAHLDLPLLRQLWPVALLLAGARALLTVVGAFLGSVWAKDPPVLRRWGWAGMVSQAGLTLGLSVVIERAFPSLGSGFRSLVIATVACNEVIGPVLFKLSLDRSGESNSTAVPLRDGNA